jgi:hypothetical protein
MPKFYDLAIRWNDRKSSIPRLRKAGGITVFGRPWYLRPGKQVAIVTKGNLIPLMFKVRAIEGLDEQNRYFIKGDKSTMDPLPSVLKLPIKGWYAIGAFRYFDAKTMKPVLIGGKFGSRNYIDKDTAQVRGTVFRKHSVGIPGLPHSHPEAKLVEQYVQWIGEKTRFGHNYIRASRLFVDLFDLTHWQLLEAKVSTSREVVRMAIGQLRDYKRYFHRPPTLAVLLPTRPSVDCIKLLTDNRISVIWGNASGSFSTKRWQNQESKATHR